MHSKQYTHSTRIADWRRWILLLSHHTSGTCAPAGPDTMKVKLFLCIYIAYRTLLMKTRREKMMVRMSFIFPSIEVLFFVYLQNPETVSNFTNISECTCMGAWVHCTKYDRYALARRCYMSSECILFAHVCAKSFPQMYKINLIKLFNGNVISAPCVLGASFIIVTLFRFGFCFDNARNG